MFTRITTAFVVLVALTFVSGLSAQELNGKWSATSGIMNGSNVPPSSTSSMSIDINGADFQAMSGGLVSTGTLGANTLANPPQIEFTISGGADQGRKVKAIYQLANDTLKIAFSQDGQYPTSIDSGGVVMTYSKTGSSASMSQAANKKKTPRKRGRIGAGRKAVPNRSASAGS